MKRPFARLPEGGLIPKAVLVAATLFASCGGPDAPGGPSSPGPSASGFTGAYVFEIRPACSLGGPVTFPMTATPTSAGGAAPYRGVQVVVTGEVETLEIELQSLPSAISGGFGTTERGALANEAIRVWMRAIGTGPVTRAPDGRDQIVTGRLAGYIAFGHAGGTEGSLGACTSNDHSYTLRVR